MGDETEKHSAWRAAMRSKGIDEIIDRLSITLDRVEDLQTENKLQAERIAELSEINLRLGEEKYALKQENTTLRATAELVETALRDYVLAQSRMSERWVKADEDVRSRLWRDLHFCEALGREALEALKANTAQPTNKPTDSDGSST